MTKSTYKIGEEVEITEDFEFKTLGGRRFKVKEGDKGILTSRGTIIYTTGAAKNLMQVADCNLKGYDNKNIAKLIYENLNRDFNIDDYLNNEDIDVDDFIETIECSLEEIL